MTVNVSSVQPAAPTEAATKAAASRGPQPMPARKAKPPPSQPGASMSRLRSDRLAFPLGTFPHRALWPAIRLRLVAMQLSSAERSERPAIPALELINECQRQQHQRSRDQQRSRDLQLSSPPPSFQLQNKSPASDSQGRFPEYKSADTYIMCWPSSSDRTGGLCDRTACPVSTRPAHLAILQ